MAGPKALKSNPKEQRRIVAEILQAYPATSRSRRIPGTRYHQITKVWYQKLGRKKIQIAYGELNEQSGTCFINVHANENHGGMQVEGKKIAQRIFALQGQRVQKPN